MIVCTGYERPRTEGREDCKTNRQKDYMDEQLEATKRTAKIECLKQFVADSISIPYERELDALKFGFEQGYAAARQQWVAVETPPETPNPWPVQVWVLIRINDGERDHDFYESGKYYEGEWFASGGKPLEDDLAKVIAWQPIQPYKQEVDELFERPSQMSE